MSKNKTINEKSLAGRTLGDIRSTTIQKRLAGCVLCLCNGDKTPSEKMKELAFNVLINDECDITCEKLAIEILLYQKRKI